MQRTVRSFALGLVLAAFVGGGSAPVLAVEPDERLGDAALEARARALSADLRCLVCQNQSIDDSNAPLARDLRLLVRERIKAGDSDAEVKTYLVARYGDFVLLKPPFSASTLLLWLAPLLALAAAVPLTWRLFRTSGPATDVVRGLSAEEEARLKSILERSSD